MLAQERNLQSRPNSLHQRHSQPSAGPPGHSVRSKTLRSGATQSCCYPRHFAIGPRFGCGSCFGRSLCKCKGARSVPGLRRISGMGKRGERRKQWVGRELNRGATHSANHPTSPGECTIDVNSSTHASSQSQLLVGAPLLEEAKYAQVTSPLLPLESTVAFTQKLVFCIVISNVHALPLCVIAPCTPFAAFVNRPTAARARVKAGENLRRRGRSQGMVNLS